jgi:hypothetical protein
MFMANPTAGVAASFPPKNEYGGEEYHDGHDNPPALKSSGIGQKIGVSAAIDAYSYR